MKKKFLTIVAMVLLAVTAAAVFAGCAAKPLTEEEQAVVGEYELTEVSVVGYPSISVGSYDFFTLEFFSNRKCTIKSKMGINEYSASATWKINAAGKIEVITKSGPATATEVYTLSGDTLSGTNSSPDGMGGTITMTISFQRITE